MEINCFNLHVFWLVVFQTLTEWRWRPLRWMRPRSCSLITRPLPLNLFLLLVSTALTYIVFHKKDSLTENSKLHQYLTLNFGVSAFGLVFWRSINKPTLIYKVPNHSQRRLRVLCTMKEKVQSGENAPERTWSDSGQDRQKESGTQTLLPL